MNLKNVLNLVEETKGIVLIEYTSHGHPEHVLKEIVDHWREKGVKGVIVDILDTLHIFTKHLSLQGVDLDLKGFRVIKEKGKVNVGNVVGEISEIEDFDRHMGIYSRVVSRIPRNERVHTVVLGVEKFSLPFMDNRRKLEEYFEKISRVHLRFEEVSVLFLNTSVANEYLTKSFEQDCDYVLRVDKGVVRVLKAPGGEDLEVQ
jgi:hypothetical protein